MADDGTFELDPQHVTEGGFLFTELGSLAWGILAQFNNVMADTSWTGDDKNGLKIRANFVENRDATSGSLSGMAESLELTGEAILMNLGSTQDTQEYINDGIEQETGNYGARRG